MALLSVEHLSVHFHTREGVVRAVDGVSFSVEPGEVLGIVGESGSGKSVACYSLLGLIPMPPGRIESGRAEFDGIDLLSLSEKQLRRIRGRRISMVFQDPMTSLNPYMRIGDQLVESLRQHHRVDKKAARERAILSLEEVGIREARQRIDNYPHEFSGGMRQRVMVAMALITEPELLIADEPTTALDVTVQAQILDLIKEIQRRRNLTVVFISHDLGVVAGLADHILVMKSGQVVEAGPPKQIFRAPQHPYTRQLIEAIPTSAKSAVGTLEDTPLLDVRELYTAFPVYRGMFFPREVSRVEAVKSVSLSVRKGEILGLVGESGSGKSTLGRSIMRLVDSQSGEVWLDGKSLSALRKGELKRARRDFQMIFQDPYASLNPRMTVFDTLAEPLLLHGLAERGNLREEINQLMDDVGLDRRSVRKYPHEFSGGQRQRVAIARALAVRPRLIVADEPVSALDVTIQAQILDLLLALTQRHGLTMLFISHDLAVVRYLCDRVAVMRQGELVEQGETEAVFSHPQHPYTRDLLDAIPSVDFGTESAQ
ncbi:ABC transporter ATP-binding protein [Marinimicrobium sp. C2-29]|uniref:ABC transporter ATP-binding protein n=1 Tax=Marinimicrobium sp. C2-29 TaxID=3139825 RepID=UPI003138A5BD